MNHSIYAVFAVSTMLISTSGLTQEGAPYLKMGYSTYSETYDDADMDVSLGYVTVAAGYSLTKNFALEAFVGSGVSSDTVTVLGVDVDMELNQVYGFNLIGQGSINDKLSVFGELNWMDMEVEASVNGYSAKASDSDTGVSVGLAYTLSDNAFAQTKYTFWGKEDSVTASGFNVGLGYRF